MGLCRPRRTHHDCGVDQVRATRQVSDGPGRRGIVGRLAERQPVEVHHRVSGDHRRAWVTDRHRRVLEHREPASQLSRLLPRERGLVHVGGVNDERDAP